MTQKAPLTPSSPAPAPRPPSPLPLGEGQGEGPAAGNDLDVEAYVAREGRKARLQASIAILATEPSLKEYKERAERYLFDAYPETAPGDESGKAPVQVPPKETKS